MKAEVHARNGNLFNELDAAALAELAQRVGA